MFDWITWSIWTIAFFILVVFIVQPIREFRRLYQEHKTKGDGAEETETPSDPS